MVGVAAVDMLPGGLHAGDFFGVFAIIAELGKEGIFELGWGGAGKNAGGIHIRVAGAGETEIDYTDDFVVVVK